MASKDKVQDQDTQGDVQDETTADTQAETAESNVPPSAEVQAEAAKRAKTQYAEKDFPMEVFDELPGNEPATRGRDRVYFDLLVKVADDQDGLGKWHQIARFGTDNGAITAANQLVKQLKGHVLTEEQAEMKAADRPDTVKGYILPTVVRDIPEYESWVWDFAGRRVASTAEGAKPGDRESVLFARLVEDGQAGWQNETE